MHIDEVNIEFIAQKIVNNEIEEKILANHFNECELCKSKLEFFISFYKNLSNEYSNHPDEKIEEFALKISTPRIINLKYYQPEINNSYLNENKNILILAADTKTQTDTFPINVIKFASKPHKVLIRIVEDKNKNIFHVYILSENEEYRNYGLIGISDGNGPINFTVMDKNGCGIIQFTTIKDWRKANVLIFVPAGIFIFDKGILNNDVYKQNFLTLKIKIEDESTGIYISSGMEKVNRLLIILNDGNKILRDNVENKVSLPNEQAKKVREIRLY